jgi:acyl-CoA thioesterase I
MGHVAARLITALTAVLTIVASVSVAKAQIVALGASNTAGKYVNSSEAFPAVLEGMLRAKGINMTVINAGASGDTTAGMLGRLDSAVPAGTKIVILQVGGNDARRNQFNPAEKKANISQILQRLRARGIRVIRADPLVRSAILAGMELPRGHDMSVEGHRKVAAQLAAMIR